MEGTFVYQKIVGYLLVLFVMPFMESKINLACMLKSLYTDNKLGKRAWVRKLGRYDFTLASILLLKFPSSSEDRICLTSSSILKPENFVSMVRSFSSWIVWSDSREEPVPLVDRMIELSKGLLEHHQYEAVEVDC